MSQKKAYLMEKGRTFEMNDISSAYVEAYDLNMVSRAGHAVPLVAEEGFGMTESKTMQAPGDDDPDPEDAGCY